MSDRAYAKSLPEGLSRMAREGGLAELYAGFIPIVAKQVPYVSTHFLHINKYLALTSQ